MKKYWVPALERADSILRMLAIHPAEYRLMDLSKSLEINKSSMFSLLNTMENLQWIQKEKDGTYSLGLSLGMLSASYFRQFNLVETFHQIAPQHVHRLGETAQLSSLNGNNIFYLAKQESKSPIRIATDPGMRRPAHGPSLGKVLLSQYSYEQLLELYPEEQLEPLTPYTITNREELWKQLQDVRRKGYATEKGEVAEELFCVAAPIWDHENQMIASVSFTMLEANWNEKRESAITEVINLAHHLSEHTGHAKS
jgi:IclR family transcriptional regulator, KDG regulon repressor